jgi:hypothetical protein
MANYEVERAARVLRREAKMNLQDDPGIQMALKSWEVNPEEFSQRVGEFEMACRTLGRLVETDSSGLDPDKYGNVLRLKGFLNNTAPLTLFEAIDVYAEGRKGKYEEQAERIGIGLIEAEHLIERAEVAHLLTDNQNKLISVLLVFGYAIFVDKCYEENQNNNQLGIGLRGTMFLAMIEVLITNHLDTGIGQGFAQLLTEAREGRNDLAGIEKLLNLKAG